MTIYTIGHSTRSFEDFLSLLQRSRIECLVDVRTFPGSRRHPHFNREVLEHSLQDAGIEYLHRPALGGRRRPPRDAPPSAWRNEGFRGYAAYMQTPAFRAALDDLIVLGDRRRTAIMCSEAVPWRCHRALISDALTARGVTVEHILDAGESPHRLTSFAVVHGDEVTYPPTADFERDAQHALEFGDS
ncbi:MAG: DUF488 family protein [Gemmatimonadaceae bacterium]